MPLTAVPICIPSGIGAVTGAVDGRLAEDVAPTAAVDAECGLVVEVAPTVPDDVAAVTPCTDLLLDGAAACLLAVASGSFARAVDGGWLLACTRGCWTGWTEPGPLTIGWPGTTGRPWARACELTVSAA